MAPNFTRCAIDYLQHGPIPEYVWNGTVKLIPKNTSTQISYNGCLKLCGNGNDLYQWSQASNTITTWILPIIGILLQAPFESNEVWRTVLATARWIGSPISSLSYILWNISVSGKCAMMVDMAVSYDARIGSLDESKDFDSIRDSFYILMVMNQYEVKPIPHRKKEAESLLRFVLFSKDLELVDGRGRSLARKRGNLAESLRRKRRRGVVPVFISTAWFLFSLALSIQNAFGLVGQNATAHDLALGLLLGWLPILVLCSIVDRNPLSADDVQTKLNALVKLVCESLRDRESVKEYVSRYCREVDGSQTDEGAKMEERVNNLVEWVEHLDHGEFFVEFAGQGRRRWHYGVAHPILSDIENSYVASRGRYWMRNENEARTMLVLGSTERGLFWFDYRQLWHISSAIVFVVGNCLGAYILSYYTPTVGLGCRSLGYLIFAVNALGLLLLEFVIWWSTSEEREEYRNSQPSRSRRGTVDSVALRKMADAGTGVLKRAHSWLLRLRDAVEDFLKKWIPIILSYTYLSNRKSHLEMLQEKSDERFRAMRFYNARDWSEILFFVPLELCNMAWLIRVVLFQTFGKFVNCYCQASLDGFGGGYLDLSMVLDAELKYVYWSWMTGTILASVVLAIGLLYVVTEWCLQSHISTLDREAAREGLQRTRAFRRWTYYARYPLQKLILGTNAIWYFGRQTEHKQKTLVWTRNITHSFELNSIRSRSPRIGSVVEMYSSPPSPSSSPNGATVQGRARSLMQTSLLSPPCVRINSAADHDDDDGFSSVHLAYSDAGSSRGSMDDRSRVYPRSYLTDDAGDNRSRPGLMLVEPLRTRPTHHRQQSDDIVGHRE